MGFLLGLALSPFVPSWAYGFTWHDFLFPSSFLRPLWPISFHLTLLLPLTTLVGLLTHWALPLSLGSHGPFALLCFYLLLCLWVCWSIGLCFHLSFFFGLSCPLCFAFTSYWRIFPTTIMPPKVEIEGFFTVIEWCCWGQNSSWFFTFGLKWVYFFFQYFVSLLYYHYPFRIIILFFFLFFYLISLMSV